MFVNFMVALMNVFVCKTNFRLNSSLSFQPKIYRKQPPLYKNSYKRGILFTLYEKCFDMLLACSPLVF